MVDLLPLEVVWEWEIDGRKERRELIVGFGRGDGWEIDLEERMLWRRVESDG